MAAWGTAGCEGAEGSHRGVQGMVITLMRTVKFEAGQSKH